MKRKVKIGIVGAGAIGNLHLNALKTVPEAEVVALCDILGDKLVTVAGEFGIPQKFTDHRKMLKDADLDAVYVCTPNGKHCEITVNALKAGNCVFCEKPMAINATQGRKMVATAKSARKVLQLGMVLRQSPEAKMLKSFIDKGYLGDIYHIRLTRIRSRGIPGLGGWFTTKSESGGGGLIDVGVHFIDLAMWLANQWKPKRVSAATYAKFGPRMRDYVYTGMWAGPPKFDGVFDVDDYACGMVRFPKNVTMSLETSWAANVKPSETMEILGDKGGITSGSGAPATIFTEQNGHLVDLTPKVAESNMFEDQAAQFVNAVLGKEKPGATGKEGVAVMKVLDAVYKSAKLQKEVVVPD